MTDTKTPQAVYEAATKMLGLETLEERKMDDLDFHELAVWQIQDLIDMAYKAGREA